MDGVLQNWHVFWAAICFIVVVVAFAYFRRHPDKRGAGVFFRIFPFSDPTGEVSSGLTPRAVVLFLIGLLIIILAVLFIPDFK